MLGTSCAARNRCFEARAGRTPDEHRCTHATLRTACHAIDEAVGRGTTTEEIVDAEGLPSSQVATALACLKERGCVSVDRRRTFPSGADVFMDAMIEYRALLEKGPEEPAASESND